MRKGMRGSGGGGEEGKEPCAFGSGSVLLLLFLQVHTLHKKDKETKLM